jgi:hypothetical protein
MGWSDIAQESEQIEERDPGRIGSALEILLPGFKLNTGFSKI